MKRKKLKPKRPLKPRDHQVLQHVARYRLTTSQIVRRAVLIDLSHDAVTKRMNRFCASGYLHKYTLVHPTRYYVLGAAGAYLLGLGEHRVFSLGPQSLPVEFAILAYALLGRQPRERLTRAEILQWCPWLVPSLADAPHCSDPRRQVLELVRVDLGGPAHHVARKCVIDVTKRRHLQEFLPFVAQGQFRLVVITATSEKSRAVRQALQSHDWPKGLLVHFSVVPQLLSVSAR